MKSFAQQFEANWKKLGFVPHGAPVLLAISGGIDSMAMAHLFLTAGIPFAVGTCNFQLRGEEADKDQQMVIDWCAANSVECHSVRFDTEAKMELWKKGVQETARILRYEWLEQIRKQHDYAAIATAHHANDNAETLLMNLFKGTGISGLHGILPKNNYIIRPLLFATKKELTEYVKVTGIPYRDDASNASSKYLRNDVRLNLIPVIEQSFPNVLKSLNNSIQRFAEAEVLYNKALETERKKLIEKRGKDFYVAVRKLQKREPLHTICYELFKPFGFATGQVNDIVALLDSESGHYVSSATHRVIRNRDFLVITEHDTRKADTIAIDEIPRTITTEPGVQYKFQYKDAPVEIVADENIACINTDKLEPPILLRKWKQGDYFYPLGMGMKKKKLSKFLVEKKIPIHEKEHIMVLESNKRIVWVPGYRLDERFKVTPSTKQVLVARLVKRN